jgi:hypothetical protein
MKNGGAHYMEVIKNRVSLCKGGQKPVHVMYLFKGSGL